MEQFPTFENQEKSKLEIVREVLAEKGAELGELVAELGGEQVFEKADGNTLNHLSRVNYLKSELAA